MKFLISLFLVITLVLSLISAQEVLEASPKLAEAPKPVEAPKSFTRKLVTRVGKSIAYAAQGLLKSFNTGAAGSGQFDAKLHGDGRGALGRFKGGLKWDGFVKSKFGIY
ncbi:hypothetical protein K7432_012241 [Basidiobolus ranarum]|uniref:Uncharacterized protein n=1 Tax=Basidiobolus ranarum TaxID=34480 RepID=A0ABR2WL58_9FUNG